MVIEGRLQRQKEILSRSYRKQWAVMEYDQTKEGDALEEKLRRQWQRMEQTHRQESDELEERHPTAQLEKEKERLLDKCIKRRQRLEKMLEKEVREEVEREVEKELQKQQRLADGRITDC